MPGEIVEQLAELWPEVVRRNALPGRQPAPTDSLSTRVEQVTGRGTLHFGWIDFRGTDSAAMARFARYSEIFNVEARAMIEWIRLLRLEG